MTGYREIAPPRVLHPVVACLWEHRGRASEQRVIPDGCVDLIWRDGRLVVVGADTGPVMFAPTSDGEPVTGIRLRPGAAGSVLGLPASEVLDARVPVLDLWPDLASMLSEELGPATPQRRLELLAGAVERRQGGVDALVVAAAHRLAAPDARVTPVASDLGVSERHLHRRTVAAIGYGPKMLARVARLRRLIALSQRPNALPLAERAGAAGYASQAHMSDEVRRLTGLTPVRFLEDATLTAA